MRILIFGDSITQGFYDEDGGWATRLVKHYISKEIQTHKDVPTIFNLGISGDTTLNVLNRFESEAMARLDTSQNNAIIFAIGTNDTVYRQDEFDSTPERYLHELNLLTQKAKVYTDHIFFVGLFPVVDGLLQPFPWSNSGKCYSTERMKLFNNTLAKFCADHAYSYIDLWKIYESASDLKLLFFDGIHPNKKGHEIIAQAILPKIDSLIQ